MQTVPPTVTWPVYMTTLRSVGHTAGVQGDQLEVTDALQGTCRTPLGGLPEPLCCPRVSHLGDTTRSTGGCVG